jgi:flagellar hook-basal body complex protein FliE
MSMSSMIPAAVSLFGAPLGAAAPVVNPAADFSVGLGLGPGLSTAASGLQIQAPVSLSGSVAGADGGGVAGASLGQPAPFADLLTEAVGQVEQYESQAQSAVEGLMSGRGVDVHQAMIATEKAEMGFELMLSVRNKALAAYQQVMGLQF